MQHLNYWYENKEMTFNKGVNFMKFTHLLALLPFLGILGGIPFANKTTPYVMGMPFILFWIVMWVILTSGIMAVIFKLDPANKEGDTR